MTKTEIAREILSRITWIDGLKQSDISKILDVAGEVVVDELNAAEEGATVPVIPTFFSVKKIWKPAKKSRMGTNPFTGEKMRFKAKPAQWAIKARVLKKVKDGIQKSRR